MADPRHTADDPDPAARPDSALIAAWLQGDEASLDQLIRRYQKPIYRLILRTTGDAVAAEDLAQRAFLKAIDRLPRLTRPQAFQAWLFRIALNLARNSARNRRRWRMTSTDAAPPQVSSSPSAQEALEHAQDRARMHAAIEKLPRMQREVVRLRLQAELPFRDIAQILDTSEQSAKVSYHHAVRTLRDRLRSPP